MNTAFGIILITFSTAGIAALLGLGLAIAARKFRIEKDKRVESIEQALPGLNCGVCGYAGCESYAEALSSGEDEDIGKCKPGANQTRTDLAEILGKESTQKGRRMVARLACLGAQGIAKRDFVYQGYADCEAARIHFGGDKGCKYGCLGLGSCVKSCPVDAISYTQNGLVEVNEETCIGCEICVAVCPTGVMKMIPADAAWFVACNSKDKAKLTKSLCSAGCIGCRICERKSPQAGFIVEDNLSSLDYNKDMGDGQDTAADACPPKCILRIKDE